VSRDTSPWVLYPYRKFPVVVVPPETVESPREIRFP